jgi:hypothetical protein
MPISREEVHSLFSKKFHDKDFRRHKKKVETPKVNNALNNGMTVAKSKNIYNSKKKERMLSPNEGGVAVNGKAGGLITKVGKKEEPFVPTIDEAMIAKKK